MSNDVTFVFGTGNVAVQPGIYAFRIYVIDIPNECGTLMKKYDDLSNYRMYTITVDNVIAYRELLVKVGRVELGEIKKFVFHGYTFDFSNYNQASMDVMKDMLDTLFNNSFIIGVAC